MVVLSGSISSRIWHLDEPQLPSHLGAQAGMLLDRPNRRDEAGGILGCNRVPDASMEIHASASLFSREVGQADCLIDQPVTHHGEVFAKAQGSPSSPGTLQHPLECRADYEAAISRSALCLRVLLAC